MQDLVLPTFFTNDLDLFKMPIIVIYESPSDYPNKFVARLFDMDKPLRYVVIENDLETLRSRIPTNRFMRNPRDVTDDLNIVESYF
jgi:hypothetical protein